MQLRRAVLIYVIAICFVAKMHGQASITVYPQTVYKGQTATFLVTGVNTQFAAVSGARFYPAPTFWTVTNYNDVGPAVYSNTYMQTHHEIPSSAPTGFYHYQLDGWGGHLDSVYVTDAPSNSGWINGTVRHGVGTNCFSGLPFANQVVEFTPGPYYAYTNAQGEYGINLPLGTYSMIIGSEPTNHTQLCPSGPSSQTLSTNGQTINYVDFYLEQAPVVDVAAQVFVNAHRPGFNTTNYIILENLGGSTATNITVKARIDPVETYQNSVPTGAFLNDTITWTVPSLAPNASELLYFTVVTPLNSMGWTLGYSVTATPAGTDVNLANNFHQAFPFITASFDPNDKQVWTQDNVVADGPINPTDTLLRYLVRFQNTGTDTAFNIFVRDTLDANLDWQSLTVTGSSHTYQYTVENGNEVEFFFPIILLPDSNVNEPGSHGHIEFTVKPLPGLPLGTEIDNTAHIYFDFNAPVVTNTVTSKICPEVNLDFSTSVNQQSLTIANNSTGNLGSILWDFGDGNTSTAFAPTHTYASAGTFNVCLAVTDTCGVRSLCKLVNASCSTPTVAYNSTANQLTMSFNDQSSSANSWSWTFGDGNGSTLQNPSHTYLLPGTYYVCLSASDSCGSATFCDSVTVTCAAPTAGYMSSSSNLVATFSNQSSGQGSPTYSWDFGDGMTSTQANPVHTYASTGVFLSCLTVTDICGSATFCDWVTITCPAPSAAYTWTSTQLQASFSNQSTGQGTPSYLWDFGDGNTSTQQDPSHSYAASGSYLACLTITDLCGSVTLCDTITVVCLAPTAAFGFQANGTQVQFSDQSSGSIVSWLWDFGDGNTSSQTSPLHNYAGSGSYTACLISTNDCGAMDTTCQSLSITGMEEGPIRSVLLYPNPNDGRFNLNAEFGETGALLVQVRDLAGRTLYEANWGEVQGQLQRTMEMDLPAGSYFLQLELNGRRMNRMFSIQ